MRYLFLPCLILILGSGCAISDLQRVNQKLKNENDSLLRQSRDLKHLAQIAKEQSDDLRIKNEKLLQQIEGLKIQLDKKEIVSKNLPEDKGEAFQNIEGIKPYAEKQGIRLVGAGDIFFKSGSCVVNSQGKKILDKVSSILKQKYPLAAIRVFGHTDNEPIKNVKKIYKSNWELSCARACAVVRYLQNKGIDPKKLSAVGNSFYIPVASNNNAAGRKKNRRVEILVLK